MSVRRPGGAGDDDRHRPDRDDDPMSTEPSTTPDELTTAELLAIALGTAPIPDTCPDGDEPEGNR